MSATLGKANEIQELELCHVVPSPMNPRTEFDQVELKKLADSLKAHGQLQEIVVFTSSHDDTPGYEIIAGERRFRAAKIAKFQTVRCRVIDVTEEEAIELRGIENFQREDFNAIEEAKWFQQMIENCNYKQAGLAKKLGVTQSHISNRIRLLTLPEFFQKKIISREILPTQARQLVPLVKHDQIKEALENNYSAKECEDSSDFNLYIIQSIESVAKRVESYQVDFIRTKEIDKELDLCKYKNDSGYEYEFALNVDLVKELQKEARKNKKKTTNSNSNGSSSRSATQKQEKRTANDVRFLNKISEYNYNWLESEIEKLKEIPEEYIIPLLIVFGSPYEFTGIKKYLHYKKKDLKELINQVILKAIFDEVSIDCLTEAAGLLGIKIEDWEFDQEILKELDAEELELIAKDWKLLSKKADRDQFAKLEKAETRRLWIVEHSEGLTAPKCLLKVKN